MLLFMRPHMLTIHFVVPPSHAVIRGDHVRAGVDVTCHALAGRNRTGELVPQRMTGLILRNRGIGSRAETKISKLSIHRRMLRCAIVRIDHVTATAPAGPIVPGLVVGARKREQGIEQSGLLQPEEYGIRAELGPEAAIAQFDYRLAGIGDQVRIADIGSLAATTLENAQHVPGLRNLPALDRIEVGKHALFLRFLERRRRKGHKSPREATGPVALAEPRSLEWNCAVV